MVKAVNDMTEKLQGRLEDAEKFDKGNSAAGARLRKVFMAVRSWAREAKAISLEK